MRGALLLGLFAATLAPTFAADPPIRLPVMQAAPVAADAPIKLSAERLYVIDSDVEVFALCSPPGILKVNSEPGPLRIRGKFADGADKVETRTYKGKFIYTVDVVEGQGGRCELVVIPKGVQNESDILRRLIDAGVAPQPPPPGPTPDPVNPPPFPSDGFRVLILFDGKNTTLPASQLAALRSAEVYGYLNDKTPLGKDGKTREFRVFDVNDDFSQLDATWAAAVAAARGKPAPWVVISTGKTGTSEAYPKTTAEALALLKKYGN